MKLKNKIAKKIQDLGFDVTVTTSATKEDLYILFWKENTNVDIRLLVKGNNKYSLGIKPNPLESPVIPMAVGAGIPNLIARVFLDCSTKKELLKCLKDEIKRYKKAVKKENKI